VLGLDVLSLVGVVPSGSPDIEAMERDFAAIEQVEAAYSVAGEESHLLVVRTRTITDLAGVLQRIRGVEGVAGVRTSMVLSTAFERGPAV
jgi:Lrp/AsnC family leucine-responsive transcriptional regulator